MWAQVVNALLGIWLMAASAVLGYDGPAVTNDQLVGPLATSFAVIAWWQATRPARWANVPLGLWLLAAPWILGYAATAPTVNSMAVGALLAALSFFGGTVDKRFGGGWRAVWGRRPMHEQEVRELP